MASRRPKDEAISVRKAKAKARARTLKGGARKEVVSVAGTIDSKCLKGPLIFDKIRIPEFDAEADDV